MSSRTTSTTEGKLRSVGLPNENASRTSSNLDQRKRFRPGWKSAALGIFAVLAISSDVLTTTTFVGGGLRSLHAHVSNGLRSPEDKRTDEIVRQARTKMPWVNQPTIYLPSVEYLRDNYSDMTPFEPHGAIDLASFGPRIPFAGLFEMTPAAAGQHISVQGKVRGQALVAADENAAGWALELVDPAVPDAILMVRFPTSWNLRPSFGRDELVDVDGIVLADGTARSNVGDSRGYKVIYFIARAVISTDLRKQIEADG